MPGAQRARGPKAGRALGIQEEPVCAGRPSTQHPVRPLSGGGSEAPRSIISSRVETNCPFGGLQQALNGTYGPKGNCVSLCPPLGTGERAEGRGQKEGQMGGGGCGERENKSWDTRDFQCWISCRSVGEPQPLTAHPRKFD